MMAFEFAAGNTELSGITITKNSSSIAKIQIPTLRPELK